MSDRVVFLSRGIEQRLGKSSLWRRKKHVEQIPGSEGMHDVILDKKIRYPHGGQRKAHVVGWLAEQCSVAQTGQHLRRSDDRNCVGLTAGMSAAFMSKLSAQNPRYAERAKKQVPLQG